jgi:hypothetical protein
MRLVQASWTVALDVEGEALSDVRRFSNVKGRVDKLFRPPVSVFDVNRARLIGDRYRSGDFADAEKRSTLDVLLLTMSAFEASWLRATFPR